MTYDRVQLLLILMGTIAPFLPLQAQESGPKPSITITQAPPSDPGGPDKMARISGTTTGACKECVVVIYSKGDVWYVQPWAAQPFTDISETGQWSTDVHLGTEYAAILARRHYQPPARTGTLPAVRGDVLAITTERGKKVSASEEKPEMNKALEFAGYLWDVKSSREKVGPGPNYFSEDNVWVDAAGRLHLKIQKVDDKWTCGEVVNQSLLGAGEYTFDVDVPDLPPEVVLGLFSWDPGARDQHFREVDVEIGRWGDRRNKNAQFVIQPYTKPENVFRFEMPSGTASHSIVWQTGRAVFRSSTLGSSSGELTRVEEHSFSSGVPDQAGAQMRINLWVTGTRPESSENAEVMVKGFHFRPVAELR